MIIGLVIQRRGMLRGSYSLCASRREFFDGINNSASKIADIHI